MLSKGIEKRCGIFFRPCFSSGRNNRRTTPTLDARAYQAASADTRMRANASVYICDRLRTRYSRHLRAFYMHAHVHARTNVRARVSWQGRNFTPVGETASHERENYCTTRDLSLIINTPTPGIFKRTRVIRITMIKNFDNTSKMVSVLSVKFGKFRCSNIQLDKLMY